MVCRKCGTEIADRALICFKCGTATQEAKFKPADVPAGGGTSGQLLSLVALVVLVALALFLGRLTAAPVSGSLGGAIAAAVLVLIAIRLARRRR
jgi:hypothetical protein